MSGADGRVHRAALLVLSAAVLAGFGPGVFGDFLWDDQSLIVHNRYVRDWTDLPRAFSRDFWDASGVGDPVNPTYGRLYRPIVKVAYVLQFQAFGARPLGWHLVSLGLHLACSLLAYSWLRARLRADAPGLAPGRAEGVAALAGLLFVLHPTRVESVTWVSGSTDLWMALAVLGGLRLWDRRAGIPGAVAAGLCFVVAALAKEAAVVVPFLLIVDEALRGRRPRVRGRGSIVAGMMLAFLGVRLALLPPPIPAGASAGVLDAATRVLASAGHFLASTFWPWQPSTQVGRQIAAVGGGFEQATGAVALGLAALALGVVLSVAAWRRPGLRGWLGDALWFVGPLVPVMNLFPMGTYTLVSERFLYLPILGVAALAGRSLAAAQARPRPIAIAATACGGALVAALLVVTVPHLAHFQDDASLWEYEQRLDPENLVVVQQSATMALRQRRHSDAIAILEAGRLAALSQRDATRAAAFALGQGVALMEGTSDADLPTLLAVRAFLDGFERSGRLALEAGPVSLSFTVPERVHANLAADPTRFLGPRAAAWARTAPPAQAESFARELVALAPHDAGGHVLLSLLLARQGRFQEADAVIAQAAHRFPGDRDVMLAARRLNTAAALAATPAPQPAERVLRDARVQLALGSPAAARRELAAMEDVKRSPEFVLVAVQVEVADRRFETAIELLEQAARQEPEHAELWRTARERVAEAAARESGR